MDLDPRFTTVFILFINLEIVSSSVPVPVPVPRAAGFGSVMIRNRFGYLFDSGNGESMCFEGGDEPQFDSIQVGVVCVYAVSDPESNPGLFVIRPFPLQWRRTSVWDIKRRSSRMGESEQRDFSVRVRFFK